MEHNIRSQTEAKSIDFKIKKIIKHSGYSRTNFNNDIALIMVDREIKFDKSMGPVCLPEKGEGIWNSIFFFNYQIKKQLFKCTHFFIHEGHSFAGMEGLVTGWGATSEGGIPSQNLREVKVPILSLEACRKSRYPARRITDNMLCAGYPTGKKDSCQVIDVTHRNNDTLSNSLWDLEVSNVTFNQLQSQMVIWIVKLLIKFHRVTAVAHFTLSMKLCITLLVSETFFSFFRWK